MLIRIGRPDIFQMSDFLLDKATMVGAEVEAIRIDQVRKGASC